MSWTVRAGVIVAVCAGLVALPTTVGADPGDGEAPTYTPTQSWEAAVDCGDCSIAVGDGTVYVHERAGLSGGRLRAFVLSNGEERWTVAAPVSGELEISNDGVLVHDKAHYEIHDPATGALVTRREGFVVEVNLYGILVAQEDDEIVGVDVRSGEVEWRLASSGAAGAPLAVADVCRDIVIVVERGRSAPFRVLDQRTGDERWRSDDDFDHRTSALKCGGWWIYTVDGEHLTAYDAPTGFTFFQADAAGDELELYREVALVPLDDGSGEVIAVNRLTGFTAWQRPLAEIGSVVSAAGRLRREGADLLTVDTHSGSVVNRLSPPPGQALAVAALSEGRVTISSGTVVATYGLADLGRAWQLDLGAAADDVVASDEVLVARFGGRLVAYR